MLAIFRAAVQNLAIHVTGHLVFVHLRVEVISQGFGFCLEVIVFHCTVCIIYVSCV